MGTTGIFSWLPVRRFCSVNNGTEVIFGLWYLCILFLFILSKVWIFFDFQKFCVSSLIDRITNAMIDYIKGKIIELLPTDIVIECGGIGYHAYISLQTFAALDGKLDTTLYIHHILREDDEMFYGFASKDERQFFRLLIGVSGVGANTARMMLSSLSADEIREAILSENVSRIKSIKGIGSKTAQRIILELKDKIVKGEGSDSTVLFSGQAVNATADEAITALVMLGFPKPAVQKLVGSLLQENPTASVEVLIKTALQRL